MASFDNSLYLGLRHPSEGLPGWDEFTTGVPAALREPPCTARLKRDIAHLQRCESATLGPSTLHVFCDLSVLLAKRGALFCIDSGTYPIALWTLRYAACSGAAFVPFRHHDAGDLRACIRNRASGRKDLIVVTDAFCPDCGCAAPLPDYRAIATENDGLLLIDDSQALGVLGERRSGENPYGTGGGGTLPWFGLPTASTIIVASLAKGFGVPLTALAGPRAFVEKYEAESFTRVHSSPPAIPTLRAMGSAISLNREVGDARRSKLAWNVLQFRRRAIEAGFAVGAGLFPVQTVYARGRPPASRLHARLRQYGIQAVLSRGLKGHPRVRFVITATHTIEDIENAVQALVEARSSPAAAFSGGA